MKYMESHSLPLDIIGFKTEEERAADDAAAAQREEEALHSQYEKDAAQGTWLFLFL